MKKKYLAEMELSDTVELMNNEDYKKRFIAEYVQTRIRYKKLNNMLNEYKARVLSFVPNCPIDLLELQLEHMGYYLQILEIRALIEKIDLPK